MSTDKTMRRGAILVGRLLLGALLVFTAAGQASSARGQLPASRSHSQRALAAIVQANRACVRRESPGRVRLLHLAFGFNGMKGRTLAQIAKLSHRPAAAVLRDELDAVNELSVLGRRFCSQRVSVTVAGSPGVVTNESRPPPALNFDVSLLAHADRRTVSVAWTSAAVLVALSFAVVMLGWAVIAFMLQHRAHGAHRQQSASEPADLPS